MSVFGKRTEALVPSPPAKRVDNVASEEVKTDPVEEHRACTRMRTLKAGLISYQDHSFTIKCAVRDISEAGARLKLMEQLVAPDSFLLLIELDSIEVDCEVCWRRGDELGIRFSGPVRTVKKLREQVITEDIPVRDHSIRRQ